LGPVTEQFVLATTFWVADDAVGLIAGLGSEEVDRLGDVCRFPAEIAKGFEDGFASVLGNSDVHGLSY